MPYQPGSRYQLRTGTDFSTYSVPRHIYDDGSYEIHLVKASDPNFIPADMEIWPLYYQAITDALRGYPDAFQSAAAAYLKVREQHQGKQRRD